MDKSLLIVDTPPNCDECDICYTRPNEADGTIWHFCPINGWIHSDLAKKEILSDCPLKLLPLPEVTANEYDFENYYNGVRIGWNRCLEKITGEKLWKK